MGFLDTLRKLGILKVGAEAKVYTKATDRPDSFSNDDFTISAKPKPEVKVQDKSGKTGPAA